MKQIMLAAALAACAASPAFAATKMYMAPLAAQSEVPPNGSPATGKIEASYDTASKTLTWSGEYSGLTGPATMAHFHGPAPAGQNSGVAVPVDAKTSPFKGSATLTDAQAAELEGGKWYFNVHTEMNKGGEIRGQMVPAK